MKNAGSVLGVRGTAARHKILVPDDLCSKGQGCLQQNEPCFADGTQKLGTSSASFTAICFLAWLSTPSRRKGLN